jgi:hypothetical protein
VNKKLEKTYTKRILERNFESEIENFGFPIYNDG